MPSLSSLSLSLSLSLYLSLVFILCLGQHFHDALLSLQ